MIYAVGGLALVLFSYGLTVLRSVNERNSQTHLHSVRRS